MQVIARGVWNHELVLQTRLNTLKCYTMEWKSNCWLYSWKHKIKQKTIFAASKYLWIYAATDYKEGSRPEVQTTDNIEDNKIE